jgi:hypothetical protein
LNYPDFVIQTFDKSERNLILWFAEGGNAIPVAFDQFCKLLIWFKPLPLYRGLPVIKKLSGPGL